MRAPDTLIAALGSKRLWSTTAQSMRAASAMKATWKLARVGAGATIVPILIATAPKPTPNAIAAWKTTLKIRFAMFISSAETSAKGSVPSAVNCIEREAPEMTSKAAMA